MKDVDVLKSLLCKYIVNHQISININILTWQKERENHILNLNNLKCIKHFIEPLEGWDRRVTGTDCEEACYYCRENIKKMFPEEELDMYLYNSGRGTLPCYRCYDILIGKYLEGKGLKLKKKAKKFEKIS